uniref:Uncharacterized protein n=1 Tax=Cucumis melo TaxID=3656 RepID=A0A9I9D9D2_CUCME
MAMGGCENEKLTDEKLLRLFSFPISKRVDGIGDNQEEEFVVPGIDEVVTEGEGGKKICDSRSLLDGDGVIHILTESKIWLYTTLRCAVSKGNKLVKLKFHIDGLVALYKCEEIFFFFSLDLTLEVYRAHRDQKRRRGMDGWTSLIRVPLSITGLSEIQWPSFILVLQESIREIKSYLRQFIDV